MSDELRSPEDFYTRDSHNEGLELQIKDGGGNLSPCFFTVVGPDSDIWRDALGNMQRDALYNSFAGAEKRSNSELRAEYLAKAVIDSRGFDGDMTEDRVKTMFIMAPYVSDQVEKFISKRENFIKPSAEKS